MTQLTVKHLEKMFGYLQNCCLHSPVWTPVDADRVLCSVWRQYGDTWNESGVPDLDYGGGWKDGTDSESYTVVLLKNGWYGLLSENEDYTGHGCQCGAATNTYQTLNGLLQLGVDNDGAREEIRQILTAPFRVAVVPEDLTGDLYRAACPGRSGRHPPGRHRAPGRSGHVCSARGPAGAAQLGLVHGAGDDGTSRRPEPGVYSGGG